MNKKWFNFKLVSSFIVLIMVTWNALFYDDWAGWGDIWFCGGALCIMQFVDALDSIGGGYKKVNEIMDEIDD